MSLNLIPSGCVRWDLTSRSICSVVWMWCATHQLLLRTYSSDGSIILGDSVDFRREASGKAGGSRSMWSVTRSGLEAPFYHLLNFLSWGKWFCHSTLLPVCSPHRSPELTELRTMDRKLLNWELKCQVFCSSKMTFDRHSTEIYVNIHSHSTQAYIHKHTEIFTYIHWYLYTVTEHIHMHTHTHILIYTHTCTDLDTYILIHICYIYTYWCIYTCTHWYRHVFTHMHTLL